MSISPPAIAAEVFEGKSAPAGRVSTFVPVANVSTCSTKELSVAPPWPSESCTMRFLSMVKKLMFQNSVVPDGNDDAEGAGDGDRVQ